MKPVQTVLIVLAAMLVGAGVTYWTLRYLPPHPAASSPPGKSEATETTVKNTRLLPEQPELDEAELDTAVAEAKEARKRGELKPAATTPEEFARALGAFNFRLLEFTTQFPERPEDESAEAKSYDSRIGQLTREYANLVVDEGLLAGVHDDNPQKLAHLQACMAAGSLDLNGEDTVKLEEILRRAYDKLFPIPEDSTTADAKIDAATREVAVLLSGFLNPDQRKRLDLMGTDQVLFGLPQPEEP